MDYVNTYFLIWLLFGVAAVALDLGSDCSIAPPVGHSQYLFSLTSFQIYSQRIFDNQQKDICRLNKAVFWMKQVILKGKPTNPRCYA